MELMDAFFKMDIFFVIAAIGFVILAILIAVILVYVIQLLRTLNRVADNVEDEAQSLRKDLDAARAHVKRGGLGLLSFFGFARKAGTRLLKKKRRSS